MTVGASAAISTSSVIMGMCTRAPDPTAAFRSWTQGRRRLNGYCAFTPIARRLIVAGGVSGVVIYSEDGASFQACSAFPVGIAVDVTPFGPRTKDVWLAGCSNGEIYYTLDQGENWVLIADWGAAVMDISFSTDSVGYAAYSTVTPRGGIRRTYDGGYSWKIIPEGVGTIPANDRINAMTRRASSTRIL